MRPSDGAGTPAHPSKPTADPGARSTAPIGPKHLTPETAEKVLAYERLLCRQLPSHHIKHMQDMFRAILRMVECDAQLAQMSTDHTKVKNLMSDLKTILASDSGTAQTVSALNTLDRKW